MIKNLLLIVIIGLVFSSCEKYDVQYSGETPLNDTINRFVENEVIVLQNTNNQLLLTDQKVESTSILLSTSSTIEAFALNAEKDKVAYKTRFDNIKIINLDGEEIAELPNTSNAFSFEFHSSGTLYYLSSTGVLQFYGDPISVPDLNVANWPKNKSVYEILGVSILDENVVMLFYRENLQNNIAYTFLGKNGYFIEDELYNVNEVNFIRTYETPGTNYQTIHINYQESFYNDQETQTGYYIKDGNYFSDFGRANSEIYLFKNLTETREIRFSENSQFIFSRDNAERASNLLSNQPIYSIDF